MGLDPERKSEYANQIDAEGADQAEDQEEEDTVVTGKPMCPSCGWRNTRPSHTKTILDAVLRNFAFRPYRCRSCGNRFRVMRRAARD